MIFYKIRFGLQYGQRSPGNNSTSCRMGPPATQQLIILISWQTSLMTELSLSRLIWCGRRTVLTATLSTSSSGGTSCSMSIAPSHQLLMSLKRLLKISLNLLTLTWLGRLVLQQGRGSRCWLRRMAADLNTRKVRYNPFLMVTTNFWFLDFVSYIVI